MSILISILSDIFNIAIDQEYFEPGIELDEDVVPISSTADINKSSRLYDKALVIELEDGSQVLAASSRNNCITLAHARDGQEWVVICYQEENWQNQFVKYMAGQCSKFYISSRNVWVRCNKENVECIVSILV